MYDFIKKTTTTEDEHWIAVSDLMAGLMMVFLMIAIIFMADIYIEREKIKNIAVLYDHLRKDLYTDLYVEFKDDLPEWGAELTDDLKLKFFDDSVMFEKGDEVLNDRFKEIIDDFFPRYLKIIGSDKYNEDIVEIKINGHTSTGWGQREAEAAYIKNMDLSQARTRSVLAYILSIDEISTQGQWLKKRLTANGLSSSQPFLDDQMQEVASKSRRVEFELRTDAESHIATIVEGFK